MHKLTETVGRSLLAAALLGAPLFAMPAMAHASVHATQQQGVVKGTVKDKTGEPAMGAAVLVVGTRNMTTTDANGNFTLKNVPQGATIRISLIGYTRQDIKWTGGNLNVVLEDAGGSLNEVVVTAMGILRKEKSLTYATQQIKNDDLTKVQDANLANNLEGKISGLTVTASAGGAGGASKIQLRGAQSILGDNAPLIVVDGVPMTNETRNEAGSSSFDTSSTSISEGSDALSMFNSDDIESINVLKGANAAALYGSRAANGVIMITTKKGREGKVEVTYTSNVTFEKPMTTPKFQNIYGADVVGTNFSSDSWGSKLAERSGADLTPQVSMGTDFLNSDGTSGGLRTIYLRNSAGDDLDDFYQTGVTTNNSISLSGGTDKVKNYFSFGNSHSNGMLENNNYNRNTLAFRQSYKLFDRVHIEASINYMQTRTKNRIGGGTVMNPIYDMYTMPRNVDIDYYRNNYSTQGYWQTNQPSIYYSLVSGSYKPVTGEKAQLSGLSQEWVFQDPTHNNPYWLTNQNWGVDKQSRVFGYVSGKIDIYDGLAFQARLSYDHSKYDSESVRYATTQGPNTKYDYGTYYKAYDKSQEIYTDYLVSYNKTFRDDYSVSATAGFVGHVVNGSTYETYLGEATEITRTNGITTSQPTRINYFYVGGGDAGVSSYSESYNWDKAALVTAQFGWKDAVYIDGSYRRDWYRAFRQFRHRGTPDNYGYFSAGASADVTSLLRIAHKEAPSWLNYLKYRLSYSEVGNSIPNMLYSTSSNNNTTGAATTSTYLIRDPKPEVTRSWETGFEAQFFDNRLAIDFTFYNTLMANSYITRSMSGYTEAINSAKVRNRGAEATVSYNFRFGGGWQWKTSVNYSYNKNKILRTARDENGNETPFTVGIASGAIQVIYQEGGSYGDMYVNDFLRYEEDAEDGSYKKGWLILDPDGLPQMKNENKYTTYAGNMYAKHQLGWSNTITWKNFQLFFLINGRIGGKVVSLTEAYLDRLGLSERTGKLRQTAEAENLYVNGEPAMYLPDGSGRLVGIQDYYELTGAIGSNLYAPQYTYSGTNFRLRELSLGYTFRDLLGENRNLTLSFIGRNLFFIYKDAPVDPEVALSTGNGLSAFELFNLPSARSYGVSLKLNF